MKRENEKEAVDNNFLKFKKSTNLQNREVYHILNKINKIKASHTPPPKKKPLIQRGKAYYLKRMSYTDS